jgi:hypothetical protein
MTHYDFLKLMMRVRSVTPMDYRVVAALDHPDVQGVLRRHTQAVADRAAKKRQRPTRRRLRDA